MKNVIAYVRVSTDGQVGEDKFGIDSQKNLITAYCVAHDMTVTDWYIDKGESGVKENRPQLDAILYGDVRNPPVEAVVVAKSDRVARDIKLYYYFMMLLEKRGLSLISATEEVVNDDTGLGNVYKALMLFVAEQERNNITKRTSGGRAVKASKGGYSGGRAPYGYAVKDKQLIIVPDEAAIVREIFDRKGKGETYQSIVDTLNGRGVLTKTGKQWAIGSVQSIYENRKTYEGFYRYGKGADWVEGQHEPILKETPSGLLPGAENQRKHLA